MGQMAAGIAHEINNPLGVVLMYAHLLKEELDSSNTASQDVDVIIRESERTRKIVQGILNFARKEKIERAAVDINTLVSEAAESIQEACAGNLHVELDLDGSLEPQQVDASQLRQVFDNLLKNAAEFMPDGGTITVATQAGVGDFRVRIADAGPGIPEEHLSRIFSPFFTTKPVGKGTGLGLAVCYGIVKMHGGTIQAGNNPDGGAYFEIVIKQTVQREESCATNSVM
jgi:signal transduction histidine kinase